MSEMRKFKALLSEKLATMTLEISELFDRMIAQHENEIQVFNERSRSQRQLLDLVLMPHVVLRRSDAQAPSCHRIEDHLHQDKATGSPHIKDEQEDVSIKQEPGELQVFLLSPDSVKSESEEDKPISIHPSSPQTHETNRHLDLGSGKQPHPHSDGFKPSSSSSDPVRVAGTTDNLSISPSGLDSFLRRDQIDGDSQSQVFTDNEDSDEWFPGAQSNKGLKKVILNRRHGKNLKSKILGPRRKKQEKSADEEGSEAMFKCTKCLKTFLRKIGHSPEDTTCCSECNAKPERGRPKRKRTFICSICKKGFRRPDNLSSHMLIHTGERPHSCPKCNKSFTEKGHLKAHMIIHTGEKPFSCSICQKRFAHRATLDRHEKNHLGERPFSCSDCGAKFKQRAHYLTHLVTHSGERPFSCPICKKTYTRKSHVTGHMRTVHESAPIE